MAETKFNLERYLSIAAICIGLIGGGYTFMQKQTSIEYLTKQDFNTFQLEYTKKATESEGAMKNGFQGLSQQIGSLAFVSTKDFQDLKDKTTATDFELSKQIEFLKKDLEQARMTLDKNSVKISIIERQIAVLEAQKSGQ